MLNKDGIATNDIIASVTPSKERLAKGPVAVVECFQCIPCNPCYTACKRGAMKALTNINERPQIDYDKCNGCAMCVSACPGLAIFVIDETYSDNEAIIKMPYEFYPLPLQQQKVKGVDRSGKVICEAEVVRVVNAPIQDRTAVVWLKVPKQYSMSVRFFKTQEQCLKEEDQLPPLDGATVICRCENVTIEQIRKCISQGLTSVDEIKRITRAGMGACSGRTCRQLIQNEIARMTGVKVNEQPQPTFRPPTTPIRMELLAKEEDDD